MTDVFDEQPPQYPDLMEYPYGYLASTLIKKAIRRVAITLGMSPNKSARMVWSLGAVSDADGPTANVRNYIEQSTLRKIMQEVTGGKKFGKACEVGCGYGRVIMVLKEFADSVTGFEREPELLAAAKPLLPDINFQQIQDITSLPDQGQYDFAMTSTVLQHLSDDVARGVCGELKRLVPNGHVLLIEKIDPYRVTENQTDGTQFLSRARDVEVYQEYMAPFELVKVWDRYVEPTYSNPKPGKCMLFKSK